MGEVGRGLVGALILWIAAVLGLLATGGGDTCTGGSADPLTIGIVILFMNLLGMLFLLPGVRPWVLGVIISVPALAAIFYTVFTYRLIVGVADGASACSILLGQEFNMLDGSEWTYVWQWSAASLIFWLGLAVAVKQSLAYRVAKYDE